jgi:hypothetical protein
MRVLAWGTDVGGLDPVLGVYDSHGSPVAATVLVNENGAFVAQVPAALPNTDYYVAVQAEQPGGPHGTGNYFLGVEFSAKAVNLQNFAAGTLTQSTSQKSLGSLQVNQDQLFHLALSAGGQAAAGATLTMTIYDQSGSVVATLSVPNGQTQTITLLLSPGAYTIQVAAQTSDGSPLSPMDFSLLGLSLSDPIGPQPTDPTLTPTNLPPSYTWLAFL